ncbi:MFS transporter [Streptomyces sp. NPDC005876]|uniref:MFS transporter n=1 Tax=Streptomyces sp. NPDC005876 TaxID=3157076 RepID=UPI0033EAD290
MNGTSSQPGAEGAPGTGREDPADARAAGPDQGPVRRHGPEQAGARRDGPEEGRVRRDGPEEGRVRRDGPTELGVRRDGPARGLWSRDFGLFFVARAVARLGDTMLPVALAAGLLQHGYGAGAVGLAMAATAAAFAGLVVFGGVIADRFSTRRLMIGADLVRLGTQALTAALFFSGHVVLWEICAIGFANGVAGAVFQPGVASTVPRLATDVQGANGAIRVAESAAQLAGPAVAGVLVGLASPGGVFAAHAATYAISALCLLLLRLPPPAPGSRRAPAPGAKAFRADLVEGWREFRSRSWLWGVILVWCVYMIAVWGPTVPLVATEVVQEHGPSAYGLINSALGAGTVVGGLLALRLRPRRMLRAGAVALVGFAAFPASVGAGLGVAEMAAGAAVAGAGLSFWGVMWATTVQTQVPPDVLNRIHAYDVAGSLAMMPVGQALAGPAASLLGTDHVLLAAGAISLVVVIALLAGPPIRDLVRADPPTEPISR